MKKNIFFTKNFFPFFQNSNDFVVADTCPAIKTKAQLLNMKKLLLHHVDELSDRRDGLLAVLLSQRSPRSPGSLGVREFSALEFTLATMTGK